MTTPRSEWGSFAGRMISHRGAVCLTALALVISAVLLLTSYHDDPVDVALLCAGLGAFSAATYLLIRANRK